MSKDNSIQQSFYYPVCQIEGCDGTLKIAKNRRNLTINYVCDKNALHRNKDIKYNDFSNEYLKKQNFEKAIENCKKHDKKISNYCNDCKKYLCEICIENCKSNNHPITPLDKYKINEKQLNYLIKSLNNKKKDINSLSGLIEEWKNELNQKIEEMKKDLEDEIKLIEKLISNYNKDFNNITYHKNILYLKDRVYDNNNYFLTKFYNSRYFYEKTNSMCNFLLSSNSSIKSFQYDYDYDYDYYDDIYGENFGNRDYDYELKAIKTQKNLGTIYSFLQIKNNYFFGIDSKNTANIYNYNKNDGLNLRYTLKIEEDNLLYYSPSISLDKNQIFLFKKNIIENNQKILILDLNSSQNKIELSSDKIESFQFQEEISNCIELKKGKIAIISPVEIKIFGIKDKIYNVIKNIYAPSAESIHFYDIQLANNEFLIFSFSYYYLRDYVEFFDFENLQSIKKVRVTDSLNEPFNFNNGRKIFIINDLLIFTSIGLDKIILLSAKNKEIVQYFQIEIGSLIFIKNEQIIQMYQRWQNGCKMTNLKIKDGTLEYFYEKTNKMQTNESTKIFEFLDLWDFQEIYYMDENEALYDLGINHPGRFRILNNI